MLADGNWVVRLGLRSVLEDRLSLQVVAEARTGTEALVALDKTRPDVLLLVVPRPPGDGLRLLPRLAAVTRVLVLADTADLHLVATALRCGAASFLVHGEYSAGDLLRAVVEARRESVHLSPSAVFGGRLTEAVQIGSNRFAGPAGALLSDREREVMGHIARGLANRQIAGILNLTEKTVKNYVNRIFAKLAVSSRAQAIVLWLSYSAASAGQERSARGAGSTRGAS